jgi:geranylgeranyl diphosphate synthase type II
VTGVDVASLLTERAAEINTALDQYLPPADRFPEKLHEAMRYAVLSSGKRLRPTLLLEAYELFRAPSETPLAAACAFECVHAYSLVHDDLPAMDDDKLRRGMPTVHAKYGEAMAILVGDALLTFAFELITNKVQPENLAARTVFELSRAAGAAGMVGGQVIDMDLEPDAGDDKTKLHRLHRMKTGAIITGALRAGAILGHADVNSLAAITTYGEKVGLLFQLTDDILDVTSTAKELGKATGKDSEAGKTTFPGVYGLEESVELARRLADEARETLAPLGVSAERLGALADFIVTRTN